MSALLAVDAGVRTGLALLDCDGRLLWCRSHNLGTTARLKKAAARILFELPGLEYLIIKGGGQTAEIWEHAACGTTRVAGNARAQIISGKHGQTQFRPSRNQPGRP